ncbi:MAG: histidine phosphatase family protein [Propionibacteriaceae bacterium]|nr:histidine phosphatase family protein [Propionibacteriaceae bacterium]
MRLILVRHGRTSSNVGLLLDTGEPGADLDEHGRRQAEALVRRLADHRIDAIFASNLVRTQQTAAPVAAARGLTVRVLPGLREVPAGEDEMSADATRYIGAMIAWGQGDLLAKVPGGEDATEFMTRYDAAIDQVVASGVEAAMIVSHGAALRSWAAARVEGFSEALADRHLDNTSVIIAEGSPSEGWWLIELDGTKHRHGYDMADTQG